MKRVLVLLSMLISISTFAQQGMSDTAKVTRLPEITIESKRSSPERLKEVEGLTIFSGKKNEIIRLSSIDANLTTNNSRQIFSRVPGVTTQRRITHVMGYRGNVRIMILKKIPRFNHSIFLNKFKNCLFKNFFKSFF